MYSFLRKSQFYASNFLSNDMGMSLATYITFLFYEIFLSEYFYRTHVVVHFSRGCVCKKY
jgi:hypothetical protein